MFEIIEDQIVLAYSKMGLVIVLFVMLSVSLDFPQCVVVSDFMMWIVCLAFCVVFCMCFEYVSFGSNVSPRIFDVLYSAGSGVKSVVVFLDALRIS